MQQKVRWKVQLVLAISEPRCGFVFLLFHEHAQNRLVYGAPPSEEDGYTATRQNGHLEGNLATVRGGGTCPRHVRKATLVYRREVWTARSLSSDTDFVATRASNIMTGTTSFDNMWLDAIRLDAIYGN
jgi:hypothetical protein